MRLIRIAVIAGGLALIAPTLQAQSTMLLGVTTGGTYSTMSSSLIGGKPGYRSTFNGGVTVGMTLNGKFAIEGQALYVAKGFVADTTSGVNVSLSLDYIELPLMVTWTPIGRVGLVTPRIMVGPSLGFRVGCAFVAVGAGSPLVDCDPQNVKDFDLAVMGGMGIKIGKGQGGLTVDLRFDYGLVDAAKSSESFKNRTWLLSVGYLFSIL